MNKLVKDRALHKKVSNKAKARFNVEKQKMLQAFHHHPVTKEIQAGPEASNSSGTLIGTGNLYSFIGFADGTDVITPVYNVLNTQTYLAGNPKVTKKANNSVYLELKINLPSVDDLSFVSPMPWEPGSWLFKIERGISGLGYYIYQKSIGSASRSGSGLQSKKKVKQAMYKKTSYISAILSTFKRGINI